MFVLIATKHVIESKEKNVLITKRKMWLLPINICKFAYGRADDGRE